MGLQPNFIYSLSDSTGVRYIGKTINPTNRLRYHLNDKGQSHKARWIRKVRNSGDTITMSILEETIEDWKERETFWINYYSTLGIKLTNSTLGGDGPCIELGSKLSKMYSKQYIGISPDCVVYEIQHAKSFCEEHGINYSSISLVSTHRNYSTKGWKFYTQTEWDNMSLSARQQLVNIHIPSEQNRRLRESFRDSLNKANEAKQLNYRKRRGLS